MSVSFAAADPRLMLATEALAKRFTLHLRGGLQLPVFAGVDLELRAGECVALGGRSGSGKSSLLRCLVGNYQASAGCVRVRHGGQWIDLSAADERTLLAVRRHTIGYVSQFLRVIPRVGALDLVAEPLRRLGVAADQARAQAADWLQRLRLPGRLWALPPATFSGGEQQRVNLARGLIAEPPVLLLDEPTAALDAEHRALVVEAIGAALARGAAVAAIFHDDDVRARLATRVFDLEAHRAA